MTDLITEARELATENIGQPTVFYKDKSQRIMLRLCDALEKATAKNDELIRELSQLARESVERDRALARLEVKVEDALREQAEREKGCEHCRGWDSRCGASYCPMCGKKLPVYAGTIGGEIVQHALKELGAEEGAGHERD